VNLLQNLRLIAAQELQKYGIGVDQSDVDRDIIERWVGLLFKLIQPTPRKVHVAGHLNEKLASLGLVDSFEKLKGDIEFGRDINGHLSKKAFDPDDMDFLLCDWGIHHLHVGTSMNSDADYFVDRSDWLLFVRFESGRCYCIDVRAHSENYVFAKKKLLEVLDLDWPEWTDGYKFLDGVTLAHDETVDEDLNLIRLRKGCLNTPSLVGGRLMMGMGGGISRKRTSVAVTRRTDYLYDLIDDTERWVTEEYESFMKNERGARVDMAATKFSLVRSHDEFYLYEKSANVAFKL